jgi:hypothetical protein
MIIHVWFGFEKKICFWENTNYLFSQSTPYKEKFEDTKRVIKSRNSIEEW